MQRSIIVNGTYSQQDSRHVSTHWEQICADHEQEFPPIRNCYPGTFNVLVSEPGYAPPKDAEYRQQAIERGRSAKRYEDGNHVSPRAKVIEINGRQIEAWIYRGGHRNRTILELLSFSRLAEYLSVQNGAVVSLRIVEVPEGTPGMPGPPPPIPGKTIFVK